MTNQEINTQIKSLYINWTKVRDDIAEESFDTMKRNLKVGQKVPEKGIIYGDEYIVKFRSETARAWDQIADLLEQNVQALIEKKTEAPSEEALRAVQMYQITHKSTPISNVGIEKATNELTELLIKYGDNYQTYNAFVTLGKEVGILSFGPHPLDELLEKAESGVKVLRPMMNSIEAQHKPINGAQQEIFMLYVDDIVRC